MCVSMSALLGSTRKRVDWRFERRRCAYWRSRARRSSPPHVVDKPGARDPESRTLGGYEEGVGVEEDWLIGGARGEVLKERDSSSWKYNVGRVEPLVRLTAIEPSEVISSASLSHPSIKMILTP